MGKIKELTGKVLYGMLFVIVIPFLLIIWAKYSGKIVRLPVPEDLYFGYVLVVIGALLALSGMHHLWIYGNGLPMNAFPPTKFVKNGIYAFIKHPIYSGTVMICFGLSILTKTSSGFWLVSPLFTLMIVAFVVGFENERIKVNFGSQDYKVFLSLPGAENVSPSYKERISAYFLVFIPWILIYEAFIYLGIPKDAIITNLPFEEHLPLWEFSEFFYLMPYLFALLIPLVIRTKVQLRSFITDLWFATFVVGLVYLVLPFIVKQRVFIPHSLPGNIIMFERSLDGETCALPSFHVIWAFIFARYFTGSMKSFVWLWYILAVLISVSCITTGNHSIPDVIAGFCTYLIIVYRLRIWNYIRLQSEHIANSWHEWRWGPVRIINHGFYGGAAGFAGTLIAGLFLGRQYTITGFIIMIFVIIGAGLWAQYIEGSAKLLRPFGYYGGVIGAIFASTLVSIIFSVDFFVLLGSFAMAGPWIQAIGRLRCLVQGCCHGKPSNDRIGIRFTHPFSRVNKISGLNGVALYPTQLYSIANNLVAGLILIRLFSIEMSAVFITGIYLILNGLGRFVEESFRGEAQTPYWAGMRIYQWIAIINIIIGAILTTIPNSKTLTFQFNVESVFLALVIGILVTLASGVDFPESNRRFARLTSN
jgi:protein-S-isoprenylcysteine O-methyltransferase Ste14/membrane-associated phospholipid phosphatase